MPVMRNPSTTVRIREAASADWPAVAGLLAELGRPDVRRTAEEAEGRQLYERYLERPDTVALVAEEEGRVVAFLDMEFRMWLNFSSPQAWIPDLVVADGARGKGIGATLLVRAEEIARTRGCWSMALESATWRKRAHAFYVANGWKETGGESLGGLCHLLSPWSPSYGPLCRLHPGGCGLGNRGPRSAASDRPRPPGELGQMGGAKILGQTALLCVDSDAWLAGCAQTSQTRTVFSAMHRSFQSPLGESTGILCCLSASVRMVMVPSEQPSATWLLSVPWLPCAEGVTAQ